MVTGGRRTYGCQGQDRSFHDWTVDTVGEHEDNTVSEKTEHTQIQNEKLFFIELMRVCAEDITDGRACLKLSRDSILSGIQDDHGGGCPVGEENMACLTNLADSSGYQWGPVGGCQWIKQTEKFLGCPVARKCNGLEELSCAVAQQTEVGFLSDQKSGCTDVSKNGVVDNLTSISSEEAHRSPRKESSDPVDGVRSNGGAVHEQEHADSYQSAHDPKNVHQFPECNKKPHIEKLGWRNAGRHAENRRKRWAQLDPLLDIWKAVSSSRHAAPFRRPVALLDDYDSIIRQSMDLSTIRRQLESDESYNLDSLRRDVMLMVTNALVYNKSGSETYEMAVKLKAHACKLFEVHRKDTMLYGYKGGSSILNPGKSAGKMLKAKSALRTGAEAQIECEILPLAPVKKHRTMRRPRTCISNDISAFRSDVASGAALDSSSEEEAAAVLICFSSGQPGDEKHTLSASKVAKSASKVAKLEVPRKRLKKVEAVTDDNYLCSAVTQRERGGVSSRERSLMGVDLSTMPAVSSVASSFHTSETRQKLEDSEKYRYWTAVDVSQTTKFDKLGVSVSVVNQIAGGTPAPSSRDESSSGNRRSERMCMGLKHKWQERWRMQSAASSDDSDSLQQSSESLRVKSFGEKYTVEDSSSGETNYKHFHQVLQI
ncbi:hypothetical protein R1flu_010656 [Riccia fluitans]|uniref:Bromo domain-containing protein n=1 Tax=Riccia fluitans TaxID=41844 RepID=A0ABD1Z828_9MARC